MSWRCFCHLFTSEKFRHKGDICPLLSTGAEDLDKSGPRSRDRNLRGVDGETGSVVGRLTSSAGHGGQLFPNVQIKFVWVWAIRSIGGTLHSSRPPLVVSCLSVS